jgi:hypothetical protein
MPFDVDKLLDHLYSATEDNRRAINILLGGSLLVAQQTGEREAVNELLSKFDPAKTLDFLSMGVLMGTFAHKMHYPAWEQCRQRIASVVTERRGPEDAARLLLGFVKPFAVQKVSSDQETLDKMLGIHPTLIRHVGQEW